MNAIVGSGRMLGLSLRRERLRTPLWFGIIGLAIAGVAAGIVQSYPTVEARGELARSVAGSVGELFLIGRIPGAGVGDVALWRIQGIAAIFTGLAAVLAVVRGTRAPEEDGAIEMLGGARSGRAAPVVAALVTAAIGCAITGTVAALGFAGIGAGPGSVSAGIQVMLMGLVSATVAAVAGQLIRTARSAVGAGIAVIAAFYLLRGAGDSIGGAGYWLSPFGWIVAVSPFHDPRPVMLLAPLALVALLAVVAVAIASQRDLGAGALPDRAGPARAGAALRGPISLALRIGRSSLAGWGVGALLIGFLIGAVAGTVDRQVPLAVTGVTGGRGLAPVGIYLIAMFAAAAGILAVLRLRGDVTSGRADAVLSRPVGRAHWLVAYLVVGGLVALLITSAFGLGIGLAEPRMLVASLLAGASRAVAAWGFVALAALLVVALPRAGGVLAFVVLAAYLVLELLVEFRLVPSGALVASPFALAPQLPDGPLNAPTSLVLLVVTAILGLAATRLIRSRDLV